MDESEAGAMEEGEDFEEGETLDLMGSIEKNYKRVLGELEGSEALQPYAEEFCNLFEAFSKIYTDHEELTEKCGNMEATILDNETKLEVVTKLAEKDAETIAELKTQVDHVWKMADHAHLREQKAQETIDNLRAQVQRMTEELEQRMKTGGDEEEEGGSSKSKGFAQEKERLMGEIDKLKTRLANAISYQDDLERKNSAADLKINQLSNTLEEQAKEASKQLQIREKLENEIKELRKDVDARDVEIGSLNTNIATAGKSLQRMEALLKDQKSLNDKIAKELESLGIKHDKLQTDHNALYTANEKLKNHFQKKMSELKLKEEENVRLKADNLKANKMREQYDKKLKLSENIKANLEEDRDKLRTNLLIMQREIDIMKKQMDTSKRQIETQNREKDILNKTIMRAQVVAKDHIKLIKIQEQGKKKLEGEIESYMSESTKHRKAIAGLEKERDRLIDEGLDLTKKVQDQMEQIKLKHAAIYDLKKLLAENENKMRMQQNLFEAVRADRNAFQKSLQESMAECGELRNKLKVSSHQSEQLKEDITAKEQLLIREENLLRKMSKEKENLKVEVQDGLDTIRRLKDEIESMKQEEKRLHKVIMESDMTIRKQAKDIEQLMNERDILGSQLVRRNDELALLYEKIKILQSTLHKGEAQYEQRLDDIRLLKIEIKRLRQERNLLTKSITNMSDMRQEVLHLERDLNKERLKCKALEEELQNPLNIHRWRKLEGTDPEVLQLLKKIQLLQRRLLNQSTDLIERERQLKESELMYTNLRKVLAKQPGPEVQAELRKTQIALSKRGNKLKCLVSELNMFETQANEYKIGLERVSRELRDVKKKYLDQKKLKQLDQELNKATNQQSLGGVTSGQVKFAGGGFKMAPV